MDSTSRSGRVTSSAAEDAGRAALAAFHEARRRQHLSAREKAELRDRIARCALGLARPTCMPDPAPVAAPAPVAVHGDVDVHGDLVDTLRDRIATTREERIARCITAVSPTLAEAHLRNVLHALDPRSAP